MLLQGTLRIPSLLGRLPPLVESPDRRSSQASPQQAARPSGEPSPRDVPLSALSLGGNRQPNGVQASSPSSGGKRGSPAFGESLLCWQMLHKSRTSCQQIAEIAACTVCVHTQCLQVHPGAY